MSDPILAISPLDGRYRERIKQLETYFSEYALIRYRLFIELEWFIFICNEVKLEGTAQFSESELKTLRELSTGFDVKDALRVKEFEKKTNHDVKAVEYFIKENLEAHPKIAQMSEFIHFGCTSEDINNLAYALLLKDFETKEYLPLISGVVLELYNLAKKHAAVALLSRTHGQPASPTTIGKELINFVARLETQIESLKRVKKLGKFSGAVGNFNAHNIAYPEVDWDGVSQRFITYLGLVPNRYTTQIEPHDWMVETFDAVSRINTILIALNRDVWMYISYDVFKQKLKEGEVGSSTMPHKVNPIDFENAEGNLGLANALFRHFSEKLPISRMQRDLSDSTVQRNIGCAFGYSILAYKSLLNGLSKLEVNEEQIKISLENHWEVLTEAIQTVLRKEKVPQAYEKLKELSRGKKLTEEGIHTFIKSLKIPKEDRERLLSLTPASYIGISKELVKSYRLKI